MGHRTSTRRRRLSSEALPETVRESKLEAQLLRAVAQAKGVCIKLPAVHYAGIPDRLLLLPGGHARFLELKRAGKKPTRIQRWWLERLTALGFDAQYVSGQAALDRYVTELRLLC